MKHEAERPRFSPGESPGKSWGGNISLKPFPQALSAVAKYAGHNSQLSFAKALCRKGNGAVATWYNGRSAPIPDVFGRILQITTPPEELWERLVQSYSQLLQEGKGIRGTVSDSERAVKVGKRNRLPAKTSFGKWTGDFCTNRNITLNKLYHLLLLAPSTERDNIGKPTMQTIKQNAKARLNLSDEEYNDLLQAIEQTKEERIKKRHSFRMKATSQTS